MRDELVCRSLKEKSLASHVRLLVNDIDDLRGAWDTLNTCFDRPDKYISEALDPVIKFRNYKAFDSGAIREFYSLLRAAMMGARKAGLLRQRSMTKRCQVSWPGCPLRTGGSGPESGRTG